LLTGHTLPSGREAQKRKERGEANASRLQAEGGTALSLPATGKAKRQIIKEKREKKRRGGNESESTTTTYY